MYIPLCKVINYCFLYIRKIELIKKFLIKTKFQLLHYKMLTTLVIYITKENAQPITRVLHACKTKQRKITLVQLHLSSKYNIHNGTIYIIYLYLYVHHCAILLIIIRKPCVKIAFMALRITFSCIGFSFQRLSLYICFIVYIYIYLYIFFMFILLLRVEFQNLILFLSNKVLKFENFD